MANAHVYRAAVEDESERHGRPPEDFIVALRRDGDRVSYHHLFKVSEDTEHDIVLLKLTNETLPPLSHWATTPKSRKARAWGLGLFLLPLAAFVLMHHPDFAREAAMVTSTIGNIANEQVQS